MPVDKTVRREAEMTGVTGPRTGVVLDRSVGGRRPVDRRLAVVARGRDTSRRLAVHLTRYGRGALRPGKTAGVACGGMGTWQRRRRQRTVAFHGAVAGLAINGGVSVGRRVVRSCSGCCSGGRLVWRAAK